MSTEVLQPGPADASQTAPTSNDDGTNSGSTHAAGANYFFGFLITFIVLLLVFIGCGFGSRRRLARRRAMFLNDSEVGPWAGLRAEIAQKEPLLWEPRLAKGGGTWSEIMVSHYRVCIRLVLMRCLSQPLSITVLQPTDVEDKTASATTSSFLGLPAFSFSYWIPGSRSASNPKVDGAGAVGEMPTEPVELQLAVMIALPSDKKSTSVDSAVGPNECQFGVIHIPLQGDQTKSFRIS